MLDQSSEVLHASPLPEHTLCTANVLDILENLTLKRNVSAKLIVLMAEIHCPDVE